MQCVTVTDNTTHPYLQYQGGYRYIFLRAPLVLQTPFGSRSRLNAGGSWGWAREPYKRERVVGPCENGGRSGGEKESMVN